MLASVQARIRAACLRAARDPGEVRLVVVSKGQSADTIRRVVLAHNHHALGENRVQEWRDKAAALAGEQPEWHFIGNLQSNKVKYCHPFALIHSLNSVRLADTLEKVGTRQGHHFHTLVEVNVAGEDTKQGAAPDEAERLVEHIRGLSAVSVHGVMTIAPYDQDPEAARGVFAKLRRLRDRLGLQELSMGMSGDFEVAVEEGATIVRVGSAVFHEAVTEAIER